MERVFENREGHCAHGIIAHFIKRIAGPTAPMHPALGQFHLPGKAEAQKRKTLQNAATRGSSHAQIFVVNNERLEQTVTSASMLCHRVGILWLRGAAAWGLMS